MDATVGSSVWAVTGPLYALAGAGLLWSAVLSSPNSIAAQASRVMSDAHRKVDLQVGSALLTLGLLFQTMSAAVTTAMMNKPGVVLLLGLALGLLFYALSKDLLIDESDAEVAMTPEVAQKPQLITQVDAPIELEDLRAVPLRQRS